MISPSQSLLVWIGAFIMGVIAAAIIMPNATAGWAMPIAIGCVLLVLVASIFIKDKKIRLFTIAGSLLFFGAMRYLSAAADPIDALSFLPALLSIKLWLVSSVGQMLPEPHAGFLNGLLVGGGVRSPAIKAAFVATGTAHVMALSGWNVSLIDRSMDKGLIVFHFQKKARWIISTILVIIFVVMTGAGASLVRAAAMAVIATIASASGRRSAAGRAILYAAALMLLVSPRIIATDIGFLLSVAATLGMVYLAPFFEPLTGKLTKRFKISETVAATCGATLATLPVALVAFGQASLVALPTNILLLPFIAPTMLVGFIGAVISSIMPTLTGFCGWVVQIFTGYDIAVVKLFARIPGASMTNVSFNWLAAILMSAGMVWVVIKKHDLLKKKY